MKPILEGTLLGQTFSIQSYVMCAVLGGLLFIALSIWALSKEGRSLKWGVSMTVTGFWVAAIGARLAYMGHFPDEQFSWLEIVMPFGRNGFAVYGGLIAGTLWLLFLTRLSGRSFPGTMDALMPGMLLGLAVGRIGCFLGGCCYGKPSDGLLCVVYPYGSEPHKWQLQQELVGIFQKPMSVHPTPLYELSALVMLTLIGWKLRNRFQDEKGLYFYVGTGGYSLFRWVNMLFRANPSGALPAWLYPLIYGCLLLLSLGRIVSLVADGHR